MKYLDIEFQEIGEKRFFGVAGEPVMPVPPIYIPAYRNFYYPYMYSTEPKITRRGFLYGFRVTDAQGRLPNESLGHSDHVGDIRNGWIWLKPHDANMPDPMNIYRRGTCAIYVGNGSEHLLPNEMEGDLREITKTKFGTQLLKNYQKMHNQFKHIYTALMESRELNVEWQTKWNYLKQKLERWSSEPEVQLMIREMVQWVNDVQPKYRIFQSPE